MKMQNPEINAILLSACEQYYEYLKANDKGLEETKPIEVDFDDLHNKIKLRVRFTPVFNFGLGQILIIKSK